MEDNISIFNNAPPAAFGLFNNSDNLKNRNINFLNNNINYKSFIYNNNFDDNNSFSLFSKNIIINEENKNKDLKNQNKKLFNLDIMIYTDVLMELNKDYLIDLILFSKSYCKIMFEEKYINFQHDIFKIIKNLKNYDEYFLIAQNKEKNNKTKVNMENKKDHINIIKEENIDKNGLNVIVDDKNYINKNNINKNIDDKHKNSDKKDKIIIENVDNSKKLISIKENGNKTYEELEIRNNKWYCTNHKKFFRFYSDYKTHCKDVHIFKCENCGKFFGIKIRYNMHIEQCKKNKGNNDNENKCTNCNLIFENIYLKRIHYYTI